MDPIITNINREILEFIEQLDSDPDVERIITFWFYSNSEENIYRLAHHLQELSMKIGYCGKSCSDTHKYILISIKRLRPKIEMMNNLCTYFNEIAGRYDVAYDGWETQVEP
ncbi:ribonuclease E inhibitor RraB [Rhodohalobacter barkolensis]|nr:ribonuclease E inhibitor RraB [Rhodohalobacter barkolensis]